MIQMNLFTKQKDSEDKFMITKVGRNKLRVWDQQIHTVCVSCSVVSESLQSHGLWPARLLCPWDSPGKNTGVDCHFLLQEIFLTQGSNLGLLHCRQILYCLSYREDAQRSLLLLIKTIYVYLRSCSACLCWYQPLHQHASCKTPKVTGWAPWNILLK